MVSAKYLKNTAATATRTATALRTLSASSEIDRDDQGLLRKSAQILEALGKTKRAEATKAKREEDAREAFVIKATREATALIASWPRDTLADQLAMIRTHSKHDFTALTRNDFQISAKRRIEYRFHDALRGIPASLAYQAHNNGQPIAVSVGLTALEFEHWRTAPDILIMAETLMSEIVADTLTNAASRQSAA